MRILFINSVCDYGSTGKIVRDLSDGLISEGHEILICYGRGKAKSLENTFFFGSKIATYFHGFMSRVFGRHGLHSNRQTLKLINKITEFNPDVIHLHNIHGYYLNYEILFRFLKQSGIRVVWTLHDCWSFSGSAAHFDFYGCKLWDNGCVECNNLNVYPKMLKNVPQSKFFNRKLRSFTSLEDMTIITPSNWLKELTEKTFLNKFSVQTIYNGINQDVFTVKPAKKIKNVINLLGVANDWTNQKGLNDFLKLSSSLPQNYHITLIGLSKKQASQIPNNITVINRTQDIQELVEYYQEADIYLNLSVEETMGMTTIEALSCGTPVIVYDKTAVPEVVNPIHGIINRSDDFDSLMDTILNFEFNNYDSITISKSMHIYSKQVMINNYLNILLERGELNA